MNKERLLQLAKFLRDYVKPRWFDLRQVASLGFTEKKCGSVACALGWMPTCFPDSGLKLVKIGYFDKTLSLMGMGLEGIDYFAAKNFFDISFDEANFLFNPAYYPKTHKGRLYVANRIEQFVKSGGKIPQKIRNILAGYVPFGEQT